VRALELGASPVSDSLDVAERESGMRRGDGEERVDVGTIGTLGVGGFAIHHTSTSWASVVSTGTYSTVAAADCGGVPVATSA